MTKISAVIAAHPDDEILGCGGTIAKHIENGDHVHVLIVSEGLTSRDVERNVSARQNELSELAQTALLANKCVGSTSVTFLSMPDNRMDSVDLLDIVKEIELFKQKRTPEIIYTHNASDVNVDHQIVHKSVITACRPLPGESVKTILCFETASSTEWRPPMSRIAFMPNWFNSLSDKQMVRKIKALEAYKCEMRDFPHARSIKAIEALALWRGATVGNDYAEAFVLARKII
jgi:N-acetylglucosamine malate deacetylase 1